LYCITVTMPFVMVFDPPSILATVGWKYLRHEKARWRITKSSIATNTSLLYVTIVVQL
jgi:hypothetical protein